MAFFKESSEKANFKIVCAAENSNFFAAGPEESQRAAWQAKRQGTECT